jgi:hypothetical protein
MLPVVMAKEARILKTAADLVKTVYIRQNEGWEGWMETK